MPFNSTPSDFFCQWLKLFFLVILVSFGIYHGKFVTADTNKLNVLCEDGGNSHPHLVLETLAGSIEIKLFHDAAPDAVKRFAEVVQGPIYNESFFGKQEVGYYDGLTFSFTRPHIEIRTSDRQPSGLIKIPVEVDGQALGLHNDKLQNIDQAMDVMQFELLKAFSGTKDTGGRTSELDNWLTQWFANFDASFLIGVSRLEIYQALGYRFVSGLNSRPMKRGYVALKPLSHEFAGMELTILLSDLDDRTGKWMVIGQVVKGLEVAEDISIQPLREPPHVRSRTFIPYEPITINSGKILCR